MQDERVFPRVAPQLKAIRTGTSWSTYRRDSATPVSQDLDFASVEHGSKESKESNQSTDNENDN